MARLDRGWKGVVLGAGHVAAIEKGDFLVDVPRVERLTELGERLATLEMYVTVADDGTREIRGAQAAMLLSDVQDFLEVLAQLQRKQDILERDHEMINRGIVDEDVDRDYLSWLRRWAQLNLEKAARWAGLSPAAAALQEDQERASAIACGDQARVPTPFYAYEDRMHRLYGLVAGAGIAAANQAFNWYFIFAELRTVESNPALYQTAIAAMVASLVGRILICVSYRRVVDWDLPRRVHYFWIGLVWSLIDAERGVELIATNALRDEHGLQVSDVRTSQIPEKDVVAAGASADFRAARSRFFVNCVNLLENLPLLMIQTIYVSNYLESRTELGTAVTIVIALTISFIVVQVLGLRTLLSRIPYLRLLLNARRLVVDHVLPDDDDDRASETSAGSAGYDEPDEDYEIDADNAKKGPNEAAGPVSVTSGESTRMLISPPPPATITGAALARGEAAADAVKTGASAAAEAWRGLQKALARSWGHEDVAENSLSQVSAGQVMHQYTNPPVPEFVDFSLLPNALRRHWQVYTVSDFYKRIGVAPSGAGASDVVHSSMCFPLNIMDREAPFNALRTLEVTNAVEIEGGMLRSILVSSPTLQRLNISYCENIDDDALEALADAACPLESVYMDGCIGVTDAGVGTLAAVCGRTLLRLSLRSVVSVSDEGLCHLAKHCTQLRELYLDRDPLVVHALLGGGSPRASAARHEAPRGLAGFLSSVLHSVNQSPRSRDGVTTRSARRTPVRDIRDEGIAALALGCPRLTVLTLDYVSGPSERGLTTFVETASPYLRTLGVSGMSSVSDSAVEAILAHLRHLRELRVTGTPLADAGTAQLSERGHGIEALHIEGTAMTALAAVRLRRAHRHAVALGSLDADADALLSECAALRSTFDALVRVDAREGSLPEVRIVAAVAVLDELAAANLSLEHDLEERQSRHAATGAQDGHLRLSVQLLARCVGLLRRLVYRNAEGGYSAEEKRAWWASSLRPAELKFFRASVHRYEASLEGGGGMGNADLLARALQRLTAPAGAFPFLSLAPFGLVRVPCSGLKFNLALCTYVVMVPNAARNALLSTGAVDRDPLALHGKISPPGPLSSGLRALLEDLADLHRRAAQMVYVHPLKHRRGDLSFLDYRGSPSGLLRLATWGGFAFFDRDGDFVGAVAKSLGATMSFNGPFPVKPAVEAKLRADRRFAAVKGSDCEVAFLHPKEGSSRHNVCGAFVMASTSGSSGIPPGAAQELLSASAYMYTIAGAHKGAAAEAAEDEDGARMSIADQDEVHSMA